MLRAAIPGVPSVVRALRLRSPSPARAAAPPRRGTLFCARVAAAMSSVAMQVPEATYEALAAAMKPIDSVFELVKNKQVVLVGESRRDGSLRARLRCCDALLSLAHTCRTRTRAPRSHGTEEFYRACRARSRRGAAHAPQWRNMAAFTRTGAARRLALRPVEAPRRGSGLLRRVHRGCAHLHARAMTCVAHARLLRVAQLSLPW